MCWQSSRHGNVESKKREPLSLVWGCGSSGGAGLAGLGPDLQAGISHLQLHSSTVQRHKSRGKLDSAEGGGVLSGGPSSALSLPVELYPRTISLDLQKASPGPVESDDPSLYSMGSYKCKIDAQIGVTKKKSEIGPSKRVKVLHTQLDTVFHNFNLAAGVLAAFNVSLKEWKGLAQASGDNTYRIPGTEFFMAARGRAHFDYVVKRDGVGELTITCRPRFKSRPVRVRLYSEYIHTCGDYDGASRAAQELVEALFGPGSVAASEQVSALHLAVDFTGWLPKFSDVVGERGSRFVTPGPGVPKIEDYNLDTKVLHSLRWGKASSPIQVALYDKTREIAQQSTHKQYLLDEYKAAGWDGVSPVYRVEFRFNRDELRRLGIELPIDVDLAGLLTFGMDLLSLRDYPAGSNKQRSRWPIADVWVSIFQQAVEMLGQNGVKYERQAPDLSRDIIELAKHIGGRVASVAALSGEQDVDKAFDLAKRVYLADLARKERSFDGELVKRRDRYMLSEPDLAVMPVISGERGPLRAALGSKLPGPTVLPVPRSPAEIWAEAEAHIAKLEKGV